MVASQGLSRWVSTKDLLDRSSKLFSRSAVTRSTRSPPSVTRVALDDISMGALKGPIAVRTKAALFAGCDLVLHCNGSMEEMGEVASEVMPLQDAWLKRCDAALAHLSPPEPLDAEAGEARLVQLLQGAA